MKELLGVIAIYLLIKAIPESWRENGPVYAGTILVILVVVVAIYQLIVYGTLLGWNGPESY